MKTDQTALLLAIAALVISVAHIVVSFAMWRWSGARLRVPLPKLERHPYDPLQHRLVITVVSSGRLPAVVKRVGVREKRTDSASARVAITLLAQRPADEAPLPRTLNPGESLTAEIPMTAIVERWYPNGIVVLTAWAEDGMGRTRSAWWERRIKTPPPAA